MDKKEIECNHNIDDFYIERIELDNVGFGNDIYGSFKVFLKCKKCGISKLKENEFSA